MEQGWQQRLSSNIFWLFGSSILLGFLTGEFLFSLLLVVVVYLVWTLINVARMLRWLKNDQFATEDPPQGVGIWGDLFDAIYRMQKRHLHARQRLQSVIAKIQDSTAALNEAVLMLDTNSSLDWWNTAAEKLLGLRSPDDRGQLITNLIRDPRFASYFTRQDYKESLSLPSPVDERVILQYDITRFGQGERLLLVRDVTRLHTLEQMRKDLVGNVSHELRTPLTVIRGYLETMQSSPESVPDRWHRPLDIMAKQTDRMSDLVTDLLLLSRLENSGQATGLCKVAIRPMLDGIVKGAAVLAGKEQTIHLECEENAMLLGHEQELHSAFTNLIINAIKYTPSPGAIYIRWWQDKTGAHLAVKDEGIGIDPTHIPRLTERFYRVDSSRALATGGTGLGLAIVKHVMLRHQGLLSVRSVLGKGSTFSCHFDPVMTVHKDS